MRIYYNAELNGYSNFIVEESFSGFVKNFTITVVCTPYTYESGISGILSNFSEDEKKGIIIGEKNREL